MGDQNQGVSVRVKDIIKKLQVLGCTLLENKDDNWIMEMLISPEVHRYHLINWMLSKLGYVVGNISTLRDFPEEMLKELQSVISDMGICRTNAHDVIKGTAPVSKQLDFWCHLVDTIYLKHEISSANTSYEGIALSPEEISMRIIDEEYKKMTSVTRNICENVDIKQLFKPKIRLLEPDVEKEIKDMVSLKPDIIPTLQDLKDEAKQQTPHTLKLLEGWQPLLKKDDSTLNAKLNELEEELSIVSVDLLNSVESFSSTYNELKSSILQKMNDEFIDVGKHFKELEPHLESFSQLEKSLPNFESAYSKVSGQSSNLESLLTQLNQDMGSYSEFNDIMKLIKDED